MAIDKAIKLKIFFLICIHILFLNSCNLGANSEKLPDRQEIVEFIEHEHENFYFTSDSPYPLVRRDVDLVVVEFPSQQVELENGFCYRQYNIDSLEFIKGERGLKLSYSSQIKQIALRNCSNSEDSDFNSYYGEVPVNEVADTINESFMFLTKDFSADIPKSVVLSPNCSVERDVLKRLNSFSWSATSKSNALTLDFSYFVNPKDRLRIVIALDEPLSLKIECFSDPLTRID